MKLIFCSWVIVLKCWVLNWCFGVLFWNVWFWIDVLGCCFEMLCVCQGGGLGLGEEWAMGKAYPNCYIYVLIYELYGIQLDNYIYLFCTALPLVAWQLTIPQAIFLAPAGPYSLCIHSSSRCIAGEPGYFQGVDLWGVVWYFGNLASPKKKEIDDKMLCFFFRWVCKSSKTTNKVYGGVLSVLSDHSTSIGHLSVLLCHLWKPKWRSPQKEGWSRGLSLCDSTKVFKTAADFAFSGANLPWKRSLLEFHLQMTWDFLLLPLNCGGISCPILVIDGLRSSTGCALRFELTKTSVLFKSVASVAFLSPHASEITKDTFDLGFSTSKNP